MGNCSLQPDRIDAYKEMGKTDFSFKQIIGRGGFGKVWKVEKKKEKKEFAMKEMLKARVMVKRSTHSVLNERKLLSQLCHSFLVNMHYAFQDRENLYMVLDLMTGGDLRYHIGRKKKLPEEQTKFVIACLINGLEYMHTKGVIHRDIKPENLVVDSKGYVRITDLGIARFMSTDNSQETSGTPGYMAPEVMCRQNHGVAVDYFALGVIAYEFMLGRRPYTGKTRKDIRDAILAKQVQIKRTDLPLGWSPEAADFINKCLQRKPVSRLGAYGPNEVKHHIWLNDFNWSLLNSRGIKSPLDIATNEENFDVRITIELDNMNTEEKEKNELLLKSEAAQKEFAGYYYDETKASTKKTTVPSPAVTLRA